MARQLIAQDWDPLALVSIGQYDNQFAEGDKGEVVFEFRVPIKQGWVDWIDDALVNQGVALWGATRASGNTITVRPQKTIAFLPIIAGLILLGSALVIFAFLARWSLYKITEPFGGESMLPIFLIVGGIIYFMSQRR